MLLLGTASSAVNTHLIPVIEKENACNNGMEHLK